MSDEPLYHVDGALRPASEATINVRDRGFVYGDAAVETLRAYGGAPFAWEAHADRLRETCDVLELDHGLRAADLRARVDETLAANGYDDAYVRLSVTRGVQSETLTPDPDVNPTVVIVANPLPRGGSGSEPVWDGPATLQTVKTRRMPNRAIPTRASTHNRLNEVLARLELRVTGTDEALMLGGEGRVTEGATSNLFFVRDDALCTPGLDGPGRPDVTRAVVLELARREGIPVREGRFTPEEVREAAEVFLTNPTWELRPVTVVDGIDRDPGPVYALLSRLFDERVEREHYTDDGEPGTEADDTGNVDGLADADESDGEEGDASGGNGKP